MSVWAWRFCYSLPFRVLILLHSVEKSFLAKPKIQAIFQTPYPKLKGTRWNKTHIINRKGSIWKVSTHFLSSFSSKASFCFQDFISRVVVIDSNDVYMSPSIFLRIELPYVLRRSINVVYYYMYTALWYYLRKRVQEHSGVAYILAISERLKGEMKGKRNEASHPRLDIICFFPYATIFVASSNDISSRRMRIDIQKVIHSLCHDSAMT